MFKDYIGHLYAALSQDLNLQVVVLTIIGLSKFLLKLFLEFILGDFYYLPITEYKPSFTLFMEGKNIKEQVPIASGSSSKNIEGISKEDFTKMIKKLNNDL